MDKSAMQRREGRKGRDFHGVLHTVIMQCTLGGAASVLPLANPISKNQNLHMTEYKGPVHVLWLTGSTSLSYLPQLPVTYQRPRSCCNPTINAPTDPAESRLLAWRVLPRSVSPVGRSRASSRLARFSVPQQNTLSACSSRRALGFLRLLSTYF